MSKTMMCDFSAGDRVRRPDAIPFDFAYGREGTVVIEDDGFGIRRLGVRWDGSDRIFEYPADWPMVAAGLREGLG